MEFTTLHSVDTEYSADSIEWCTQDELHDGYFACGTYQLVEAEPSASDAAERPRKGRVYLHSFDRRNGTLERLQCIETAAILDMKWLPAWSVDSGPLLATVNALGELDIYELEHAKRSLQHRSHLALEESTPKALALALDWRCADDAVQLLVSDSLGNIYQLQYTAQGDLSKLCDWHAHGFEAWTCAFDRWTPERVYTGGDDCLLHAYDLRSGTDEQQPQRIWTNKAHGAGVTCLLSHPEKEHQLLTGSYDEVLRVFDTRIMKHALAELSLNGGIWRLKPHPLRTDLVLAACMYTNFSVVSLKDAALSLLGTYEEHSSICYGADWCPNIDKLQSADEHTHMLHMATCSFYDHKLCVSNIKANFDDPNT